MVYSIQGEIMDLYDRVVERNSRLMMSLSIGADSLAMFLHVMESERFDMRDGVYFYYWFLPGVPWVEDYIEYFESKYGVKIIQLPNPIFVEDQARAFLKTPLTAAATMKLQNTKHAYQKNDKKFLEKIVKINQGLPEKTLTAVGIKPGDSAMRRMQLRKNEGYAPNQLHWYPLWEYENRDVIALIKRHGLKMPADYDLFGISFENLDYRFAKPIKDNCPVTWELLKSWYPQIEMSVARNERYHPEWPAKKGVMYGKFETLPERRAR